MAERQYLFEIMDKSRERERKKKNLEIGRNGIVEFFLGISNGEKWKEKEDSFGSKSGILVMKDKS